MSTSTKFNRYGVKSYRSNIWHIIGPDEELVWDGAGYGEDRPLRFDTEEEALACAERMSKQPENQQ